MIRFAFVRVIQPAHAIRANMANPALVETTSKDIMETAPAVEVPDESKIDSTPAGQDLLKYGHRMPAKTPQTLPSSRSQIKITEPQKTSVFAQRH